MQLEEREPRTRRSRSEETLPERRKRTDISMTGKRLAVRTDLLDFSRFTYRWVNDNDTRLWSLIQNDWNVMTQDGGELKSDSTDMGAAIAIPVGVKKDGSALKAYLCRKPLRFHEEDQKMKQTELDEQLARLRQGNDADGGSQGDYIPSGGIRIARS